MDKHEVRATFERDWSAWTSTLDEIDPDVTREPGVCGEWNIHDVVGHVHFGLRYSLSQIRGAFDHVEATDEEIFGARERWPGDTPNTTEGRNRAGQKVNAALSWPQLLDEAAWLRDRALALIDARASDELNEDVGFLQFWNPDVDKPDDLKIHMRRVSEAPAARNARPARRFVLPDDSGHLSEHLGQVRDSLAAR